MQFAVRSLLLCFLLLQVFITLSHCKKQNEGVKLIQKIADTKAFKKLLRTKKNVMTLFAKDEKTATKQFSLLGEVALKAKGIGTLAWINCNDKDGKKLCKKYKYGTTSYDLVHFKDGEFSSVYDRKMTALSMYAFMKDPSADGPWSEEDSSSDVVHLSNEKQLNSLLKKNKPTIIMFYAPWCGHCKRFKPAFAEVATEVKGKQVLAGYDADNNADANKVRNRFNVTGFPRTLYFEKGKFMFEYSAGHSKDDLSGFLEDPQPAKPKEPEVEWSDGENDVSHLTDETFEDFVAENKKVLLFFYAPWCGHCKNLKPEWEKAATQMKEDGNEGKLAAIDAQKFPALGKQYKVTGYPTLIYFEDGEKKYTVGGAMKRTTEGIIEYINNPTEPPPPEKEWKETVSDVLHLEDSTFKSALKKKKHALVMFYAPWCGHCKAAKPEYNNAAAKFADDKKVAFAAMDCTDNRDTCGSLEVKGYPTFYYLSYGKNEEKYQRGRTEPDFISFMAGKRSGKTEL